MLRVGSVQFILGTGQKEGVALDGNVAPKVTHGGSLREHNWPVALDTSGSDLSQDFFYPALSRAVRYDRAVGYFSSGWLKANAKGMLAFAANGGKGRWITSPILAEEDLKRLPFTQRIGLVG